MKTAKRARDLGIPFDGTTGQYNAITDVTGVEVGHKTLNYGDGPLQIGVGPVRTGVTAIFPLGKKKLNGVFAGWSCLNGNGEMTGTTWIEESGFLEGPILLTNTVSVGTVRDSVIQWAMDSRKTAGTFKPDDFGLALPVVAETWDGCLNDIFGFHVKKADVDYALDHAHAGSVDEGNVGGGTGMTCYDFKGGIGTASRKTQEGDEYLVGVLVQANHGVRSDLVIRGVPVGREIPLLGPSPCERSRRKSSIIIVIATDAPLLPQQLKRLARRAALGLARTGTVGNDDSGDIFLAFSTATPTEHKHSKNPTVTMVPNDEMDPLFEATVDATEEAIINALVAAKTMTGRDNRTVEAIDPDELIKIMKQYNRFARATDDPEK